jgi:ATP-dependent DNA ligase
MARIKEYVGPGGALEPEELPRMEASGLYCAEEKRDGCWCLLETDARGRIVRLKSRVGVEFTDSHGEGLLGVATPFEGVRLVGELETASQAATKEFASHGFRRFHAFDILVPDTLAERHGVLIKLIGCGPSSLKLKILPVEHRRSGFQAFYAEVLGRGGEGLVVKRLGSPLGSGKRDDWYKVKPLNTVDYVCMGIGKTGLGNTFMELGFWSGRGGGRGVIKKVAKVQVPSEFRGREASLVGKIIEIKGAEIFDSGVVRHGRFSRIRADKAENECTLEAALSQRPESEG